ncbi:penicillin-binding protein activator [Jeongeupia chitinilytica]|uniref:Penicillin-binding protein activator n=1 Tax=Jeongeupia chitinilytica TaxID=1041641 RepID=A0ABQ3GU25_9NEIS|nr:penicillin-binding protein activator [Jeongeupia chitinilytica]GHD55028.1 hypothetical protein GCM10007350_00130 [Jeongeupia chitinilytica]
MHIQAPWRVLRRIGYGGGRGLRALLYGALLAGVSTGCATKPAPVASQPTPAPSVVARPAPVKPSPVEITPLPHEPVVTAPVQHDAYIALLLPTSSKALKPAVQQIMDGVMGAERVYGQGKEPPVRVFDTSDQDDDVLAQYNKAIDGGAAAVIGPLTRSAVNFLADNGRFPVPVVALNGFDAQTLRRANLYSFSLSVEQEASEVARLMREDGVRNPVIVQAPGVLTRRMAQGFSAVWSAGGATPPPVIDIGNTPALGGLKAQLKGYDAVFLASGFKQGRKLRPFIGADVPVYATSQISPGPLPATALTDLAGVRYLDMPWLANADDPYYALFARARTQSNDLERLFALGVDAWRVAAALVVAPGQPVAFDGVSGQLSQGKDGVIERRLLPQRIGDSAPASSDIVPDDGVPIL